MAAVAIAHQNDTVEALCWRHYGRTAGVTEAVLRGEPRPGRPRPHPPPWPQGHHARHSDSRPGTADGEPMGLTTLQGTTPHG